MKLLITGDRNWTDREVIRKAIIAVNGEEKIDLLIHGGAKGADTIAGEIAEELHIETKRVPAKWREYGNAAGPIRNQIMVNMKPDVVIAFHADIAKSRGTADCIRRARSAGIPVIHIIGNEDA